MKLRVPLLVSAGLATITGPPRNSNNLSSNHLPNPPPPISHTHTQPTATTPNFFRKKTCVLFPVCILVALAAAAMGQGGFYPTGECGCDEPENVEDRVYDGRNEICTSTEGVCKACADLYGFEATFACCESACKENESCISFEVGTNLCQLSTSCERGMHMRDWGEGTCYPRMELWTRDPEITTPVPCSNWFNEGRRNSKCNMQRAPHRTHAHWSIHLPCMSSLEHCW